MIFGKLISGIKLNFSLRFDFGQQLFRAKLCVETNDANVGITREWESEVGAFDQVRNICFALFELTNQNMTSSINLNTPAL